MNKTTVTGSSNTKTASIEIDLNAAIVAVQHKQPLILIVKSSPGTSSDRELLPFGPFTPLKHRTMEIGLRSWVREQTGLALGYVEQLYTFGDRGRHAQPGDSGPHALSIGYLALTRVEAADKLSGAHWQGWYHFMPWEDWRNGKPEILDREIEPRLRQWAKAQKNSPRRANPLQPMERLRICFGLDGALWDEEKVLERYELLYEAGLVEESLRDGRKPAVQWDILPQPCKALQFDHRRILATAMGRLRGKLRYRPLIFELMAKEFTLFDLQQTVEAIMGTKLHKQNFRRLVETAGLVEETGDHSRTTGGRPAKLFRFRRDILLERPAQGVRGKTGSQYQNP